MVSTLHKALIMKKLMQLLTLLALFAFATNLPAQSVGVKAGVNLANIGGEDTEDGDFNSITGLQFGAVLELPISDRFAIQPEVLYLQKGFGTELDILGTKITSTTTLNYLEIPILAKISLTDSPTKVYVTAGPSFGLGLNGTAKSESGGMEEEEDIDFEEDELSSLDISAAVGAGVQLPIGPVDFFIDARYLLGLNTIDDSEPEADQVDFKNRGIGLSVGVLFPLGN